MLEKLFLHKQREKIRSMCETACCHPPSPYRGRFAASPTGPLHFGSLLTALGSYLDARAQGGEWLLRIEDVDGPRTMPGATEHILRTLEALGFAWDGEVLMQSHRLAFYREALQQLQQADRVYPCACSRSVLPCHSPAVAVSAKVFAPPPSVTSGRAFSSCSVIEPLPPFSSAFVGHFSLVTDGP